MISKADGKLLLKLARDSIAASLKEKDFVYVHVEAPDEASHNRDILAKINTIEKFDELVVGTILKAMEKKRQLYRILVLPDHYTPISVGTHVGEPVLFAIMGKDLEADAIKEFNEAAVRRTRLNFDHGYRLMNYLMHRSH